MNNVIDFAPYLTPNEEPIDLLDSKLDLPTEFITLLYAVVDGYPEDWDRRDMLLHIRSAREIREKFDDEERRTRDQNNTRNCDLPMFNNRSELESALIDAHIEYEQCARALERARATMLGDAGTPAQKASRKAFEAALRAVNDAELARNRAETAISENARELALRYV
ncbi:hypothetical protein [Sinorhizobium meliloti]|uniref:hypothetical protein n=1 Tax=Rhizobium meliloti TaxID=382 RepID=UPI00299F1D10|nr:hypothetical protein [Sinorhizobium meliloti]MDW9991063.1 hypothetical protein [Sinorhizobium meliloti]MDX0245463.1 hypothetical protein [Sinorhizobium meliloti]MDX0401533.1 hypothetical protein [Sinorhizobium meliloti]